MEPSSPSRSLGLPRRSTLRMCKCEACQAILQRVNLGREQGAQDRKEDRPVAPGCLQQRVKTNQQIEDLAIQKSTLTTFGNYA